MTAAVLDAPLADADRFEFLRYLDAPGGAEHYVARAAGDEHIVATLRVELVRRAPLSTLHRLGLRTLPGPDGAYAWLDADPADPRAVAALAELTARALALRHGAHGDTFWLTACPDALLDGARAFGWRVIPEEARQAIAGHTPMALLVDDRAHFEQLGSPLADAATEVPPPSTSRAELLEALGLPPPRPVRARRRAAH
jgi:hypothetical protein